jgi:hypothetical protein
MYVGNYKHKESQDNKTSQDKDHEIAVPTAGAP